MLGGLSLGYAVKPKQSGELRVWGELGLSVPSVGLGPVLGLQGPHWDSSAAGKLRQSGTARPAPCALQILEVRVVRLHPWGSTHLGGGGGTWGEPCSGTHCPISPASFPSCGPSLHEVPSSLWGAGATLQREP